MPRKLTPEERVVRDEQKKEYWKTYYAANRDKQIEKSRQWRTDNPEKAREQEAAKNHKLGPYETWPEWRKEKHRGYTRRSREANPERVKRENAQNNERKKERYHSDEEYREARKAASRETGPEVQRERRARLKEQVFSHYGKFCYCCGETEPTFLTLDHLNDDGAEHRRSISKQDRSGLTAGILLDIIRRNFPPEYGVACYNCNCGRARNGGVCAHVKMREERAILTTTDPMLVAPE